MTAQGLGTRRRTGRTSLAARLASWWARCYTAGVDTATRERRLAEIDSDCWEHIHGAADPGPLAELSLLGRVLRGVPSDIAWRLNWKGAPEMRTNARIERLAGAGAVLFIVLMVAGIATHPGIDTRQEYFRESWTDASDNTGGMAAASALLFAAAAAFMLTALSLALSLWRVGRGYAVAVAATLGAGAALLIGGAALNLASRELLLAWTESGFTATELLEPSRTVAGYTSNAFMFATLGPIGTCLVLGWLVFRRDILPRWVGAPAAVAVVTAAIGFVAVLFRLSGAGWAFWMLTMLFAAVFLLAFAGALIARGIRVQGSAEAAPGSAA